MGGVDEVDGPEGDDFDALVLDDSFIRGAGIKEPSAQDRDRVASHRTRAAAEQAEIEARRAREPKPKRQRRERPDRAERAERAERFASRGAPVERMSGKKVAIILGAIVLAAVLVTGRGGGKDALKLPDRTTTTVPATTVPATTGAPTTPANPTSAPPGTTVATPPTTAGG